MGVSLRFSFAVKTIFKNLLRELAEIARVYAGFSPVRSAGRNRFLPPLVVQPTLYNYILCFPSPIHPFPFRHILDCGSPAAAFNRSHQITKSVHQQDFLFRIPRVPHSERL
jgi:hypothetical protein